jgi:asparagine synthase (glutamine-hydrolysing)
MRRAAPHRALVQPISRDGFCVWFDGRIDNRGDLADAFRWSGADAEAASDAAYAAEAIAAWGDAAAGRLLGDFAIVASDVRQRSALLFRDPAGLRPLHFAKRGGCLIAASEIGQILAIPGADRTPDETAVAALLAFRPAADSRTLYRSVSRVPAAHTVRVRIDRTTFTRYWSPEPRPTIARASDQAHADACRHLLEAAIRARMPRGGQAAVFFSGGIDSSVILSGAAHVARRDGLPLPVPMTAVYEEHPESDEAFYRDEVARCAGVAPIVVRASAPDAALFRMQADRRAALPDLPADAAGRVVHQRARELDLTTALTGVGGDWLFGGSPLAYADLIRRGRLLAAIRRHRLDRRTPDSGWTPRGLLTAGMWPALPPRVRARLRPAARRVMRAGPPLWLRLPVPELPQGPVPPRGAAHASADITASLRDGWIPLSFELFEQTSAEAGCHVSHPLLDRRMLEFALALPEDQRRRGTETRFVLKRAAADLLPEALLRRTTKADFGHVIVSSLEGLGGRALFSSLTIADRGWVDGHAVLAMYDRVLGGPELREEAGASLPVLWTIAAVELWARASGCP